MSSSNLIIDNEKCVHCGKCIKDCVASCLEFDADKRPRYADGGETRCIKCQHCLAICPTGALSIFGKDPLQSDAVLSINSDELLSLIKSRRSIRAYKSQNLDLERMNKLKNMLKWVPTGCNFHKMHFAFVDDIEVMDNLRNKINNRITKLLTSKFTDIPAQKFSGYKDVFLQGDDIIFRGAPHMVIVSTPISAPCANVDPVIALSYLELYAQSLGVGTLWCGFAQICFKIFPDLCEYINIPDGYKVSYVMLFGEKDIEYARTTQPENFEITSVKIPDNNKVSFVKAAKHFFWNFIR